MEADQPAFVDLGAREFLNAALEVGDIGRGLEANHVILQQILDEARMVGQRRQQIRTREGDVEKETDARLTAEIAQIGAERHEMIIVDPDEIVGLKMRHQGVGELLVHPQIALIIVLLETHEIGAVMEQRPDHAVGEAEVKGLVVNRLHRVEDGLNVADRIDRG